MKKLDFHAAFKGLSSEEYKTIKSHAFEIPSNNKHPSGILSYITTSRGFNTIEDIFKSYNTNPIIDERAASRLCDYEGCEAVKPTVYLAESGHESLPAFAFYVFDKDLSSIIYDVHVVPKNSFFSEFKSEMDNELSKLKEGSINQFLGYEVISKTLDINEKYSRFLEIFKKEIKKEMTFCEYHLDLAPRSYDMECSVIHELGEISPLLFRDMDVRNVRYSKDVKYSTNTINSGTAKNL